MSNLRNRITPRATVMIVALTTLVCVHPLLGKSNASQWVGT
jgi:hypothetical protein